MSSHDFLEKDLIFRGQLKEGEWKCHVGSGRRGWGVRGQTLLITFAANPRGLRVVAPNGDNLFWPEIIPLTPSSSPPSEDTDVKISLGMLHLFSGRVKF